MATGLNVSAALDIFIALNNVRTKRTALVMLAAGMILPIVLMML